MFPGVQSITGTEDRAEEPLGNPPREEEEGRGQTLLPVAAAAEAAATLPHLLKVQEEETEGETTLPLQEEEEDSESLQEKGKSCEKW